MLFLFSFKMNLSPFMDTCTKTLTKAGRANSNQATVMIGEEWEKKNQTKILNQANKTHISDGP